MAIQASNPFGAFLEGRQARQQEQYGQTRNALAQMELDQAPAAMERRNKLADLQIQGLEQQFSQEQITKALKETAAGAMRIAQSQNPQAEAAAAYPEFAAKLREQNPDWDRMSPEEAREYAGWIAGQAQSKLGMAPAAKLETLQTDTGGVLQRDPTTGALKQVVAPQKSNAITPYQQERLRIEREKLNKPPTADTGPLVQVAGPDGNPVYETRENAVGKPAYVARDKPAAADLKYQREVKAKIPRLNAAIRRLDRLEQAVQKVASGRVADGGELDQYLINRTPEGQELIAASAQLLPELTALTRVPGIGSQSDLESRLASLQFPSSQFPPEVNRRNAAELRAFLTDLKDAYGVVEGEFQSAEVQSLLDKYAPVK